jgi:hypothetical protein
MSLSWIPKGVLEQARRIYFKFIWSSPKDQQTPPWAKWDRLARPKALGGWGLKNIFLFSKALATKVGWRLLSTKSLWTMVVENKYIHPDSLEDWICKPDKTNTNSSIIWKVVINSFQVVGDGLDWRIGKGNKVRIGVDPWPGSGISHVLPNDVLDQIHAQGYHYLSHISDPPRTTIWHQAWKSVDMLGLDAQAAPFWDNYSSCTSIFTH